MSDPFPPSAGGHEPERPSVSNAFDPPTPDPAPDLASGALGHGDGPARATWSSAGATAPTAATPAPGPAGAPSRTWRSWAAAGAVAAVVALGAGYVLGHDGGSGSTGSAAVAQGGQLVYGQTGANGQAGGFPGGRLPGVAGSVASTDGSTLTVTGTDGTTTKVTTTGSTTVTEAVAGTLDDLAVGDDVLVMGEEDGDVIAAQRIVDTGDQAQVGPGGQGGPQGNGQFTPPEGQVPPQGQGNGQFTPPAGQVPPQGQTGGQNQTQGTPPAGFGRPVSGEITKIDGGTITLKSFDGSTVTVTTDGDTTVTVTEERTVADIAEGDQVTVQGEQGDGTVAATTIRIGDGGFAFGPGGGPGGQTPNGQAPNGQGTATGGSTGPTGT